MLMNNGLACIHIQVCIRTHGLSSCAVHAQGSHYSRVLCRVGHLDSTYSLYCIIRDAAGM